MPREKEEDEYAEIFNDVTVRGGDCATAGFHRSSERGSYPLIQTRAMDDGSWMDRPRNP